MTARLRLLRLFLSAAIAVALLLVAAVVVVIGRGKFEDPRAAAARFKASGDGFFAARQYKEAAIQYRNAVRRVPDDGELHHQLARAYAQAGDTASALGEYEIAAQIRPDDLALQKTAATVLLISGRFDAARARAEAMLARDAANVDALLLRANALAGVRDVSAAIGDVEAALAVAPANSRALLQLAILQITARQPAEAEQAYRRVLEIDPRSISAHLGLGQYYWITGNPHEAERLFQAALSIDPLQPAANRALATFYLATGAPARAEDHLKAAAANESEDRARLALADYYVLIGRRSDAERVLGELVPNGRLALEAQARLAVLEDAAGRRASAIARLESVLAARPYDEPARLLEARLLALDGRTSTAVDVLTAGLRINPVSAALQFSRASLLAAQGDRAAAFDAFSGLARAHPRLVDVHVELARLSLAARDADHAIACARQALELNAARVDARLMLARALVVKESFAEARRELVRIGNAGAAVPEFHVLDALVLVAEGLRAAARTAFSRALTTDPDSIDALAGLVTLDRGEGNNAAAVGRLEERLARTPTDDAVRMLAAETAMQTGNFARSEQLLRQVLERDPSRLDAYEQLGRVYAKTGRTAEAAAEFRKILERQPRSVHAHTMLGILRHAQGHQEEAQQHYENAVASGRGAAVAANNLAWILAESGTDLDRALALANNAADAQPYRPEILDTLGWIQHRRGDDAGATATLRRALKYDPHNPEYLYHLALVSVSAGDRPGARSALKKALDRRQTFSGAADAARLLTTLQE